MKLRRTLIFAGVLVAAGLLIPVLRHYQLRASTNAYIAKLKAQGEPMDLAQVLPPSLSPEENSADIFLKAEALLETNQTLLRSNYFYGGMVIVTPGKAMIRFKQPDLRDSSSTNSWAEIQMAVARSAEFLGLLHQLIDKPNFDFDIGQQKGVAGLYFTNLYLAQWKSAAMRLGVASSDRLHRRDAAGAVTDVRAMLAIVKGMQRDRLAITEFVRIAIAFIAFNDNWEILQSADVTDGQLETLQEDWSGLEFVPAEEDVLKMERVLEGITLENWRKSDSAFLRDWAGGDFEPTGIASAKIKLKLFFWRYWWSYSDELKTLEGCQFLLAAPRSATTNSSLLAIQNELRTNLAKLSIPTNSDQLGTDVLDEVDLHSLLSEGVDSLAKLFGRIIKVETARQLTLAAISLKRYHLKHAAYPQSLAALVPELLRDVPHDPIDGQPLRYRLNPDGTYLLYSIGDDGKDDGGDPNPSIGSGSAQWQRGRDWVWPQPATPQEVRNYYEHLPK